jgi:gamma-glutamylcyclotransferase (GGCT)/AIG2-like uncharacterized protein YtfP
METTKVFVYGTLGSGIPNDKIQGNLYDLGPYPAATNIDHSSNEIEGEVIEVPENYLKSLDIYEGVSSGLYKRIRTRTLGGEDVWVYEFARPLPPGLKLISRWDKHPALSR